MRQKSDVKIGRIVDLSNLLRFQYGEISHPSRAGKLSFRHKGYVGKTVLELNWEAGAMPFSPVAQTNYTPAVSSDFRPARGFDKIVAPATQVQLSDGLWFPVFVTREEALAFCRYVGGYARRVAPGAFTRSRPERSHRRNGFLARLSIQFPGWGEEEGVVLCRSNEVAGLGLEQNPSWVLLPVKPYSHTMRTKSGTLYVLFEDGTAFCRSQLDGACASADALYFARSYSEACNVFDKGGALKVTKVPTSGLIPLYISGAARVVGDSVHLDPRSFRCGTPVASVIAA